MLEVVFASEQPAAAMVKVIPMYLNRAFKTDCLTMEEAKLLKKAIAQSGFSGKADEMIPVFGGRTKIILAGLGLPDDKNSLQTIGAALFESLFNDERAYILAEDETTALQLAYGILLGSYSFDKYKTDKKAEEFPKLEQIVMKVDDSQKAQEAFKPYLAMATAIRYCKDLCNEPASYLTPEVFACDIKRLEYLGLEVEILDAKEIRAKGLGLIDAVAKGSVKEPRVVVASWRGNRQQEAYDLGLASKGVCFDSGGLSLKNNSGMIEMKMDMSGAAAVVAVLKAAALQRIRKNLIAIVGLVENMPDGAAMKIGDVYTAVSGKTVEVMNTDAEGRMVLADCLAYLQQNYLVKKIVDVATLGALKNVLGNVYAGLFANDAKLAKALLKAGETSGERLWEMPLDEQYVKMLASSVADLRNVSLGDQASINSAAFLNCFIEKGIKWAHIDISGLRLGRKKMASGFGVKLLNELIKDI